MYHIQMDSETQKTFKTLVLKLQLVLRYNKSNNTVKVSFEDLTTVYALANLKQINVYAKSWLFAS